MCYIKKYLLSIFILKNNILSLNIILCKCGEYILAILIDETYLIEQNTFKYEDRLDSPLIRFLDKAPTFTTYYHINVNESTVDGGFKDVEELLGKNSPIKFQKIEKFPIYGIEQIQLSLNESDQGLDTDYSGDGFILPNTIKPLQNDFFMINSIKGDLIFRVTEIQYDLIRPDNFYKISYRFEYLDEEKVDNLNNQVHNEFTCILENIGTENSCIISSEYLNQINSIDSMYNDMVHMYMAIFYSERYNCFLGLREDAHKLYDPFQSIFMNKHQLLNKKNDLTTIILSEGFNDNLRPIKYEKSIYRLFERRDTSLLKEIRYSIIPGMYKKDSLFYKWNDISIDVVDIPQFKDMVGEFVLLPNDIVNSFKYNGPTSTKYIELMQKFIRNEDISIYDIPLTLNEELLTLDANEEMFFYTPIVLYIIKSIMNDFIKKEE